MEEKTGPSADQKGLLTQLGENPEVWHDAPRHAIRNFLAGRLAGVHKARQRERAKALRIGIIRNKGLYPGMSVFYTARRGNILAVVSDITEDAYIRLRGWKNPVLPSQICASKAPL